ncbi:hypothetical protein HOG98_01795 [bacterium]|jgi:aryl-alcohol dehydrogenase-like predicted oxidoreductase|nr:hypothetical protein [bacterium]
MPNYKQLLNKQTISSLPHKEKIQHFFWMGTWSLSGFKYGFSDQRESIKVLEAAYDIGIRKFDSANFYGNGESLRLLKKVFGSCLNSIFISSKGGLIWENGTVIKSMDPSILHSDLNKTLEILETNFIDLYQLHWPLLKSSFSSPYEFFLSIKEKKVIEHFGLNNLNSEIVLDSLPFLREIYYNFVNQVHYSPLINDRQTVQLLKNETKCITIGTGLFEQGFLLPSFKNKKIGKKDIRRSHPLLNNVICEKWVDSFNEACIPFKLVPEVVLLLWAYFRTELDGVIIGPRTIMQLSKIKPAFDLINDPSVDKHLSPLFDFLDTTPVI